MAIGQQADHQPFHKVGLADNHLACFAQQRLNKCACLNDPLIGRLDFVPIHAGRVTAEGAGLKAEKFLPGILVEAGEAAGFVDHKWSLHKVAVGVEDIDGLRFAECREVIL